jgi:hypothetical protein
MTCTTRLPLAFALLLATALPLPNTSPARAAPGGQIGRLQLGEFVCELPGDATGPAGIRQPEQGFSVINATTYTTSTGRGTYLLTGDLLVMTSGPKRGQRFRRLSQNFLHELHADGREGPLRCVRQVTNNS